MECYQQLNFYRRHVKSFQKPFALESDAIDELPATEQELIQLYQQQNWHTFIVRAIESKKNIIISGGTSSGKI